jgi:hypothetical protein
MCFGSYKVWIRTLFFSCLIAKDIDMNSMCTRNEASY